MLSKALSDEEKNNYTESLFESIKEACRGSNNAVSDHFVDVNKIVNAGVTSKDIGDIQLSRYACYLIVQNGDPRKKVIALGQTHFEVGKKVRDTIKDLGGTMPEDLPTPEKSIQQLEREQKKKLK